MKVTSNFNRKSREINIKDIVSIYKEELYGIKLLNKLTGEELKPLKYNYETDLLKIYGFRIEFDTNNIPILVFAIDIKEYNKYVNKIEEMGL